MACDWGQSHVSAMLCALRPHEGRRLALLGVIRVAKTIRLEDGTRKEIPVLVGLRDRALIDVMIYTFAWIGAVLQMNVGDYFTQGRRGWVRLHEKGGKVNGPVGGGGAAAVWPLGNPPARRVSVRSSTLAAPPRCLSAVRRSIMMGRTSIRFDADGRRKSARKCA